MWMSQWQNLVNLNYSIRRGYKHLYNGMPYPNSINHSFLTPDFPTWGPTAILPAIISAPKPVAPASEAATRDAMRPPGTVSSGHPAHSASQAPARDFKRAWEPTSRRSCAMHHPHEHRDMDTQRRLHWKRSCEQRTCQCVHCRPVYRGKCLQGEPSEPDADVSGPHQRTQSDAKSWK